MGGEKREEPRSPVIGSLRAVRRDGLKMSGGRNEKSRPTAYGKEGRDADEVRRGRISSGFKHNGTIFFNTVINRNTPAIYRFEKIDF